MYNFVTNIEKNEYENFMRNSKYKHFMQSYDFGQIKKLKNFIPHYVGLKKNNKLVCVALLLEKKLKFGYSYLYSPRGFVIDFNNHELVEAFTKEIEKFAKSKKAVYIKIDPAIKRHILDQDGNIIGDENNYKTIDFLKTIGFKHLGYNVGFEHEEPRFTFRINLDSEWDEVYGRMHPTTRKILNKGNQYNLDIYKGTTEDIKDFYTTMIETSKREGILQSSIEYYKSFYEIFNKDNLSDLYIVKANIKQLISNFENKINEVTNKINELTEKNNEKNENLIKDLNNKLNKLNKDLEEIKKTKDEEIVLSSIITVKYGDTVWTVHGGNNSSLMNLNANYLCYYEIIKDAYNQGFKTVDCFGTCGIANPDKSNPIYGIHSFKKRLGGEYIEFIGEFDYVNNKVLYKVLPLALKLYRKIKRKKLSNR